MRSTGCGIKITPLPFPPSGLRQPAVFLPGRIRYIALDGRL